MDLATVRGSSILLNTLQQPLPGTILYPTKNSPWQAVVAPLPAINLCAEVPKESIIANTDFTTTSLIAKRRLSSKKRRQQQKQQQDEGSCSSLSPSPRDVDSPITQSPSVTSTLLSPSERMDTNREASSLLKQHTSSVAPTYTIPLALTTAGVPVATHQQPSVFAPVQPELALKMLHEQALQPTQITAPRHHQPTSSVWAQPRPSDATNPTPTSAQQKGSDFKWCNAHVFIAKRIRQHQQHQKEAASTHLAQLDAALQQQQQLQQQMALLQMYGALPALPNLVAPVITDTHLMQSAAMATQLVGGLAPPTTNGHAGHQLIGVQLPTVYPAHHGGGNTVPAAAVAVAPLELNTVAASSLLNGNTAGNSWAAAPVPVIGPCVVNPIQPGMFVTSWVK